MDILFLTLIIFDFFLLIFFLRIIKIKSKQINLSTTNILKFTVLDIDCKDIRDHNNLLISVLLEHESKGKDNVAFLEEIRWKYLAIFSGLITIFISIIFSTSHNSQLNQSDQLYPLYFLLLVIFIFYWIDVHFEDLLSRSQIRINNAANAILELINLDYNTKKWYTLYYEDQDSNEINNAKRCNRLKRKFNLGLIFNMMRIFYILAWIIINMWIGKYFLSTV